MQAKTQIIRCAIDILLESGVNGLTMRQVATASERSLGNLQYHFKNKEILVQNIAWYYFKQCDNIIPEYKKSVPKITTRKHLEEFTLYLFNYVRESKEALIIFKELWASATRDKDLEKIVSDYYKNFLDQFIEFIQIPEVKSPSLLATVILTSLEGYNVTLKALPQPKEKIIQSICSINC